MGGGGVTEGRRKEKGRQKNKGIDALVFLLLDFSHPIVCPISPPLSFTAAFSQSDVWPAGVLNMETHCYETREGTIVMEEKQGERFLNV